jgi:hypothetical protein
MSVARKIVEKFAESAGHEAEKKALKLASEARYKNLSPAAEAFNSQKWEVLKARDNVQLAEKTKDINGAIRAKVIQQEQVPHFAAPEPTPEQLAKVEEGRKVDAATNKYEAQTDAELAARKKDKNALAIADGDTKVSAIAPAMAIPAMGAGWTNPADVVKAGYSKFEHARQSVVDKIVDLVDPTDHNPHIPKYANDTYKKAANAIVSGVTDPLNYIGGAGAADAAIGVGGAAYDMYDGSYDKPKSTNVDNKPQTHPAQQVNWGHKS